GRVGSGAAACGAVVGAGVQPGLDGLSDGCPVGGGHASCSTAASSAASSGGIAAAAWAGTTPLPHARSAGRRGSTSVTHPSGQPIIHSVKRAESAGLPF